MHRFGCGTVGKACLSGPHPLTPRMGGGHMRQNVRRRHFGPVQYMTQRVVMEQNAARKSLAIGNRTTVDEVERRSGLDFFGQLPDAEEATVEAVKNLVWAQSWVN